MSDLISGSIYFSGLGNGTDFSTILEQLKTVESMPKARIEANRNMYKTRLSAVQKIVDTMEEAQKTINKLREPGGFAKKDVKLSDDKVLSAKAGSDAVDGQYYVDVEQLATKSTNSYSGGYDSKDAKVVNQRSPVDSPPLIGSFTYTYDTGVLDTRPGATGNILQKRTIDVNPDMTLEQLQDVVNNADDNPGVEMLLSEQGGKIKVTFMSKETGDGQERKEEGKGQEILVTGAENMFGAAAGTTIVDDPLATGFGIAGSAGFTTGLDAKYTVNRVATTSSSNDIVVAVDVEVTLLKPGASNVDVSTDKEAVEENIQKFLDAVNSVIKGISDLTDIDPDVEKEDAGQTMLDVTDPNADMLESYVNQLGGQLIQGNVLSGVGTVRNLESRITSVLSGLGMGFNRNTATSGVGVGEDLISSFASMGIKINAVEGDPNFGLFEIAPPSSSGRVELQEMDQKTFDDLLDDELDTVVDFFMADDKVKTSSSNIIYQSHVPGMATPGTYDVTYDVVGGLPTNVWINGVLAGPVAGTTNTYSVGDAGGASTMSIQINDNVDTVVGGPSNTGSLSLQQGKINTMSEVFEKELYYGEKTSRDKNGAIKILEENYKETMVSLEMQIEDEESRLARWETRKKLEFARLDTVLGKYQNGLESLQAQLANMPKF